MSTSTPKSCWPDTRHPCVIHRMWGSPFVTNITRGVQKVKGKIWYIHAAKTSLSHFPTICSKLMIWPAKLVRISCSEQCLQRHWPHNAHSTSDYSKGAKIWKYSEHSAARRIIHCVPQEGGKSLLSSKCTPTPLLLAFTSNSLLPPFLPRRVCYLAAVC